MIVVTFESLIYKYVFSCYFHCRVDLPRNKQTDRQIYKRQERYNMKQMEEKHKTCDTDTESKLIVNRKFLNRNCYTSNKFVIFVA